MKNWESINWRYAIGEICIVIIGISIAFMLNNWAENVKENRDQVLYIENLRLDLQNDIDQLTLNIKKLNNRIVALRKLLPHLGSGLPGRDTLDNSFFAQTELITFIPKDVTYQTLINSGDFKIIGDFDLKTKIEAHYDSYEQLHIDYQRQKHINEKYLADFFIYGIGL